MLEEHIGRKRLDATAGTLINTEILNAEAKQIRVAGSEEHILLRGPQAKVLAALYLLDASCIWPQTSGGRYYFLQAAIAGLPSSRGTSPMCPQQVGKMPP